MPPKEYEHVLGLNPYDLNDIYERDHHIAFIAQFRESYYINCWYLFEDETATMWKQYGQNGVATCSRYTLLKEVLDPITDRPHPGLVRYGSKHLTGWNTMRFITLARPLLPVRPGGMATAHAVRAARGRDGNATDGRPSRSCGATTWRSGKRTTFPEPVPPLSPAAQASSALRGVAPIIAAIEHPPVIARIVTHLDLPARAPPRSPARLFYPQGAQPGRSLALAFDDAK